MNASRLASTFHSQSKQCVYSITDILHDIPGAALLKDMSHLSVPVGLCCPKPRPHIKHGVGVDDDSGRSFLRLTKSSVIGSKMFDNLVTKVQVAGPSSSRGPKARASKKRRPADVGAQKKKTRKRIKIATVARAP